MRQPEKLSAYAPYNFVPFPEKVKVRYARYDDLPKHDGTGSTGEPLLSGILTFEIEAKTPILVAEGNKNREDRDRRFNQDVNGQYEIPGSTIRGLIRNAVGIIGHSDLTKGVSNRDETLMYRGLADAKEKGLKDRRVAYYNVINKQNVQAGYIRQVQDGKKTYYEIVPAQKIKGKTYTFIREQQLYKEGVFNRYSRVCPMYTKDILELEKIGRPVPPAKKIILPRNLTSKLNNKQEILERYRELLADYHKELQRHSKPGGEILKRLKKMYFNLYGLYYDYLKLCQNTNYAPYIVEDVVVYITGNDEYSFVERPGTPYRCTLMSSGFMEKKQSHYLIHPPDETGQIIRLKEEDVKSYEVDQELKGNRVKSPDFYKLPAVPGRMKPCFYCESEGRRYFGFTPYMRIFYKHTIGHGLPEYKHSGIDYVEALFGFVEKPEDDKKYSYAGRLSFKSAVALGQVRPLKSVEITPGQPRLSAVAMYIQQDDAQRLKTLNDADYKWRGIKQYWLKERFEKLEANLKGAKENKNVKTYLHMLPPGTRFQASLRFDRLHRDELGLLLAALTWPRHQTIGMGKPYGAGCVTFSNVKLFLDNEDYRLTHFFASPCREVPAEAFATYIQEFCEQMKPVCGDVRQSKPVRIYLAMREQVNDFKKGYMAVSSQKDSKEATYQSLLPLPTVEELLG